LVVEKGAVAVAHPVAGPSLATTAAISSNPTFGLGTTAPAARRRRRASGSQAARARGELVASLLVVVSGPVPTDVQLLVAGAHLPLLLLAKVPILMAHLALYTKYEDDIIVVQRHVKLRQSYSQKNVAK
jgi:hypothetical protein